MFDRQKDIHETKTYSHPYQTVISLFFIYPPNKFYSTAYVGGFTYYISKIKYKNSYK